MCKFVYILFADEGVSAGGGNRNIFDDGSSQELTEQDISHMKGQGASGLVCGILFTNIIVMCPFLCVFLCVF